MSGIRQFFYLHGLVTRIDWVLAIVHCMYDDVSDLLLIYFSMKTCCGYEFGKVILNPGPAEPGNAQSLQIA